MIGKAPLACEDARLALFKPKLARFGILLKPFVFKQSLNGLRRRGGIILCTARVGLLHHEPPTLQKQHLLMCFGAFLLCDRLGLISPILTSRSPTWNQFGAILGHLVPILGPSWKDPPRPSMHFFFSLSLGVAPKPHLNDLEPHLRAHPPHLQLSPAHLSLVPAHLGHLHPILVHLGSKLGLFGPSDEPRPHKNLSFCEVFEYGCFSAVWALSCPS